jgi:hypothetical protein
MKLVSAGGSMLLAASVACSLAVTIPDSLTTPHDAGGGASVPGDATLPPPNGPDGAGPDAPDGGAPFACAPLGTAAFCDDFDHGQPFATWDRVIAGAGFGAAIDNAITASGSGALLAHIDSSVTGDCAYARVEKGFTGSFSRVRLAVSLRAEGAASLTDEVLAAVSINNDRVVCQVLVNFVWGGVNYALQLAEQTAPSGGNVQNEFHETPVKIEAQAWQRIDLEVDYQSKIIHMRDGAGKELFQDPLRLACAAAPANAEVDVGFHCSSKKAFTRLMHADDVVFDAK